MAPKSTDCENRERESKLTRVSLVIGVLTIVCHSVGFFLDVRHFVSLDQILACNAVEFFS